MGFSIEEIFTEKDRVMRRLESIAKNHADPAMDRKPHTGHWSVKMVFEHLVLVESNVIRAIHVMLRKAEQDQQSTSGRRGSSAEMDALVEKSKREKYVTGEKNEPTGSMPITDSLDKLSEVQQTVFGLRDRLEKVDCEGVTLPHPVFGSLTLGQWLAFLSVHEERHANQMEAILTETRST